MVLPSPWSYYSLPCICIPSFAIGRSASTILWCSSKSTSFLTELCFWVAEPHWTRRRFLAPFDHLLQHHCVLLPPYADDQDFHLTQASIRTHGRPASAVLWYTLLESTTLFAIALFTEVELPAAPDYSHDHVSLHGTHWYLHLDFSLGDIQPSYADD
ncbi:hypothetical protein BHE74_00055012 [Ensete ventricosum]|nr:hypothetical protein GW17_00031676 [Ensete ventricosum]RWW39638.1 hypothetical protein BHE74_00055012 [Ensete ventricosum]